MEENCNAMKDSESDLSSSPLRVQSDRIQDVITSSYIKEYHEFCQRHSILVTVEQQAYDYMQDLIDQGICEIPPKIEQAELFASVIYMALIDARLPYGPSDPHLENGSLEPPTVTVMDLLIMADININKLFQTMAVIKFKLSLSASVQSHLTQMEKNYCIVSALFHTFQSRLSVSVFSNSNNDNDFDETLLLPIPESEGVPFRKKQCWVLFLLSKYNLLPDRLELFQHFQLLLCCLEFVLRQTPSFLLNAPYDKIRFDYVSSNGSVPMLEKLAREFGVAADETLQLRLNSTENYFQSLLNKDGELDSESLCNEYRKIYKKEGDLDELLFFSNDPHLLPPNRVTSQSGCQPNLLPEQMTPVRVVVGTVQQLQENFAKLPDEPSEKLKSYFQRCTQDPSESIRNMIASLKDNFVLQYQTNSSITGQQTVAEQRFTLGLKLYFKVLEAMMDNEAERLSQQVLNTLLNKENFHKSLLACALEVVLTTYGQSWNHNLSEMSYEGAAFSFPWILTVFCLQAFEFYKVLESFVKSEPRLPADVVKHLQNVEIQILDSLAWRESSSLFDVIGDCDLGQATPPMPASPMRISEGMNSSHLGFNGPTRSAVDLFSSPLRPSQTSFGSTLSQPHTSPATPSSLSRHQLPPTDPGTSDARVTCPPRSQSLSHFLKRVLSLGYLRLNKLCGYLGISKDLQHKIWTCFEYCIARTPALLKNRHIDQIIMCCIYGICKVVDQEIRFKSIVSEYKNLPHAKQEVFKDVYITNERHDSIINFYNNIFMQEIKTFLLQFSPSSGVRPHLSPMPKQNLASPSCYSVPGKKNFTVSPLRESPFKAPASPGLMTPRSKLLYNFGESSSEKLKEFNEAIRPRVGLASAKKRLNMDMSPSPISKVRKTTV